MLVFVQGGNDYEGEFEDLKFVFQPVSVHALSLCVHPCDDGLFSQVMHVKLVVKASEVVFSPPFSELEAIIHRLIITIVESADKMPRVGEISMH